MSASPKYPFLPRSTVDLIPGQYWSIPLSNGKYACGRVLQVQDGESRNFIAGLMDWCGEAPPAPEDVRSAKLAEHGLAHVKTIRESRGAVLGRVPLEDSELEVPLTLDQSPGDGCRLRRGFSLLGVASAEEQRKLKVFSTWGYSVVRIKAEKRFAGDA